MVQVLSDLLVVTDRQIDIWSPKSGERNHLSPYLLGNLCKKCNRCAKNSGSPSRAKSCTTPKACRAGFKAHYDQCRWGLAHPVAAVYLNCLKRGPNTAICRN